MPVRTTLSFTKRHHDFIMRQVDDGIYATQSALVADAIEHLIELENVREVALTAMSDEIRRRLETPREEYIAWDDDDNPIKRVLERLKQQ